MESHHGRRRVSHSSDLNGYGSAWLVWRNAASTARGMSEIQGVQVATADVTDESAVRRLLEKTMDRVGPINVLIDLVRGLTLGRVVEADLLLWQGMLTMNMNSAAEMALFLVSDEARQTNDALIPLG